ncbi:MAG: Npt1/Npt2 family nucleotide transporter, partial [Gemmatimonadota bacterium]
MTFAQRLFELLGVRQHEVRIVSLSFTGAFLVMSFVVLARALREASYLATFDASTLPYITGGVVALGFPLAAVYSRSLAQVEPRQAMRVLTLVLAAAVAGVWPFLTTSSVAVVLFYLVTAAGTVLLASGFWLIVSEALVIREAKRLFGLISAGGTLGLLVTGTLIGTTVQVIEPVRFVPALVLILITYAGLNELVPNRPTSGRPVAASLGWTDSVGQIFSRRHLSTLAVIVMLSATIGGLVDFQFKEAAQDAFSSEQDLAAFFGLFYGWTGGLALAVQLLLTTRIMARAGVAWSLAVLPVLLLALSAGMLILPGLVLATSLRGTDSALRKSLFRSVVEFLWVPVDPDTRRQTKTFVDTTADNVGEGLGAFVVLLIVTLGGFSSRYLSLVVIAAGLVYLALARTMGREYFATLRDRLAAGEPGDLLEDAVTQATAGPVTLSRIDLTRLLATVALEPLGSGGDRGEASRPTPAP